MTTALDQLPIDVAVVTVNYKMREQVLTMLRSLYRDTVGGSLRVQPVVVDNASDDGIVDAIAREFHGYDPEPIVIASPENIGFGCGSNIAFRAVAARYYLTANPDLVFLDEQRGTIAQLHTFLEAHLEIGILAPKLRLTNGQIQRSCMRFPAFLDHPAYRLDWHRRYRWAQKRVDRLHMENVDHAETRPIDWAVGAALFVRGSYLHEAGGFDERYFMYFEDCDFCRTFWSRGWPVYYKGDVVVDHGHERSSARIPGVRSLFVNPLTRTHLKSLVQYSWKWRGKR
ncbi:MAG: glycosyltransferase [Candidatus Uhrbacteria bacterium]